MHAQEVQALCKLEVLQLLVRAEDNRVNIYVEAIS